MSCTYTVWEWGGEMVVGGELQCLVEWLGEAMGKTSSHVGPYTTLQDRGEAKKQSHIYWADWHGANVSCTVVYSAYIFVEDIFFLVEPYY